VLWVQSKILKWIGIQTAFLEGVYDHLKMFEGLVLGENRVNKKLGIIWFAVIWKAKINSGGGQNNILEIRSKRFIFTLNQWLYNLLLCLGKSYGCVLCACFQFSGIFSWQELSVMFFHHFQSHVVSCGKASEFLRFLVFHNKFFLSRCKGSVIKSK
jgi:hypothetical protein